MPQPEILTVIHDVVSPSSKIVKAMYENMIMNLGNVFYILLVTSIADMKSFTGDDIAEAVRRVRAGKMSVVPGYDSVYGKVKIFK